MPYQFNTRIAFSQKDCPKIRPRNVVGARFVRWVLSLKVLGRMVACLLLFASNSLAQTVKPLSIDDALNTRRFSEWSPIAASPDRRFVAYAARPAADVSLVADTFPRTGITASGMHADIYLLDVSTGLTQNLTGGKGSNWRPIWSPDGRFLAFLSDRDGSGQARLWVWDTATKSTRRVSEINVRGEQITWMRDSQNILVPILPTDLSLEEYVQRWFSVPNGQVLSPSVAPGVTVTLYRVEHSPTGEVRDSQSAPWSLDWALRDLARVNVATGNVSLVVKGQRVAKYFVSPDGSRIAFSRVKGFARPGSQQTLFDIVLIDLIGMQPQTIATDIAMGLGGEELAWSPNGSRLLYRTGGSDGPAFHIVDLADGKPRELSKIAFGSRGAPGLSRVPMWNEAGDHLYFLKEGAIWIQGIDHAEARIVSRISGQSITHLIAGPKSSIWTRVDGKTTVVLTQGEANRQDAFYELDLKNGVSKKLLETGECFTCAAQEEQVTSTRDDKRLYFYAESADRDADIWTSDPGFERLQRLTHLNSQFDGYKMGRSRVINWLSDDGEPLRGALLLPVGYQEGKRYPLVVWVYGGALLSNKVNHFGLGLFGPFNMQLFATRGYAVLLPDSPQREGSPMLDLAKTVLPGVNRVVEMGIADPSRLGVMGQSNGGYSVLGLIAQTKRFKAAIEMDGVSDIVSAYTEMDKSGGAFGTSLYEHGQDALGGTLWQSRDRYIENSPLFYFDRIETPLLVVHGGDDVAVPPFLGDQVFVALRRLSKDVEYAKYSGEGHSQLYWGHANQVDICSRMLTFFGKYLVNSSSSESVPESRGRVP